MNYELCSMRYGLKPMDKITFDQFQKLDIRIGTVVKAEIPKWSHLVIKLTVDFGNPPAGLGKRTIFAGLMNIYKPKELEGKQFPFVINIEPKKIGPEGDYSQGMLLAVDTKNGKGEDSCVLLIPNREIAPGSKVH